VDGGGGGEDGGAERVVVVIAAVSVWSSSGRWTSRCLQISVVNPSFGTLMYFCALSYSYKYLSATCIENRDF
jgi:hypothetical protein